MLIDLDYGVFFSFKNAIGTMIVLVGITCDISDLDSISLRGRF